MWIFSIVFPLQCTVEFAQCPEVPTQQCAPYIPQPLVMSLVLWNAHSNFVPYLHI